jgi:hypothetical protein
MKQWGKKGRKEERYRTMKQWGKRGRKEGRDV